MKNADEKNEEMFQDSLRRLVKSSAVVFVGVVIAKILSYVYRIVIARNFGPEAYGLFSLATIISAFIITLFSVGLGDGIIRYLAIYKAKKDYKKARYIFTFTIKFILIGSIISCIILFLFSEFISLKVFDNRNLINFLKIFSIAIPFSAITTIYLSGLRAFEKINLCSFINNIFQNVVKVISLIILIILGINFTGIAWSYFITILLSFLLTYYFAKKYLKILFFDDHLNKKAKRGILKELFNYSWPIMFLGSVAFLFSWTDSFVIGYFKGVTDVGFYNVAYGIFTLFWIVPELFMGLFFPLILREFSRKNNKFIEEMSKQVAKWTLVLNIPLFIIAFLFPGAIINILFGPEYLVAQNALSILSVGGLVSSVFLALGNNLLSMKSKSKTILFNVIFTSIFNLILNLLLVPKYGLTGAAFSTSLTWLILTVIILVEMKTIVFIFPIRKKMLNVVIASILSSFFVILIKANLVMNLKNIIIIALIFTFIYGFFLILTRSLDRYDLDMAKSIFSYLKKKINFSK